MTTHESGSAAGKATRARWVDGSLNCAKDHSLLKYLGRNFLTILPSAARSPSVGSLAMDGDPARSRETAGAGEADASAADADGDGGTRKTCTVPISLVTPRSVFFTLNAI